MPTATRLLGRAALIVSLAVAGVGCANDKSIIAQANDTHKQLEPQIVNDERLNAYMQKVGDRVVASARELVQEGYKKDRVYQQDPTWMFENVQFHLVSSQTLNAFTTGGTHVYLYSELFQTTKNEDEFAAVVAHEFAHIVGRHVERGSDRQKLMIGGALAAAVGGYALGGDNKLETAAAAGAGGLAAGQFLGLGFTRKDEGEADKFGFQFYANAGWDPDQFAGFFQTLIDKGLDSSSAMMSDHPLLKDRVADARKWAQEWKQDHPNWQSLRKPEIASAKEFRDLQNYSVAVDKRMPKDQKSQAAALLLAAFPSCVAPVDQPSQVQAREQISDAINDGGSGKKRTKAQRRRAAQSSQ